MREIGSANYRRTGQMAGTLLGICRELNRKRDGGLGSRDTRDGTPSSVVEEYLLGGKSPKTGQIAGGKYPNTIVG